MTMPVLNSCRAAMLTIAAPTRTSCIRSRYWRRNARQPGSFFASASLFAPTSARRFSTSAVSRPFRGSTSNREQVSSAERLFHATESRSSELERGSTSGTPVVAAVADTGRSSPLGHLLEFQPVRVGRDDRPGLAAQERRRVRDRADCGHAAGLLHERAGGANLRAHRASGELTLAERLRGRAPDRTL